MILGPRLTRAEIAHAQMCDKIPLVGIGPETLARGTQTLTQLTKWSGVMDFFRAGSMGKFPGAIHTKGDRIRPIRV